MFVLDEADEMLSRGFKDQIYDVFKFLPETVQCAIFSATMPLEVLEVGFEAYIVIRHIPYTILQTTPLPYTLY